MAWNCPKNIRWIDKVGFDAKQGRTHRFASEAQYREKRDAFG
jgi:hypothetical protein